MCAYECSVEAEEAKRKHVFLPENFLISILFFFFLDNILKSIRAKEKVMTDINI